MHTEKILAHEPELYRRLMASIARRSPTGIRKIAWWIERAYRSLQGGGFSDSEDVDLTWPSGLQKPIRGRRHGFEMYLDLSDWSDRRVWFYAQYYQKELEILLERILSPGDCFVDIGANIGMTTLIASNRIGNGGTVLAFEPNPVAYNRLRQHIERNRIDWVQSFPFALGLENSKAILHTGKHLGKASLLEMENLSSDLRVEVEIRSGAMLTELVPTNRRVAIKIDVEGYELEVLRGIEPLLKRDNLAVIVEVSDDRLRSIGGSAQELYDFMTQRGFQRAAFHLQQQRLSCPLVVALDTSTAVNTQQHDILFFREGDRALSSRLENVI